MASMSRILEQTGRLFTLEYLVAVGHSTDTAHFFFIQAHQVRELPSTDSLTAFNDVFRKLRRITVNHMVNPDEVWFKCSICCSPILTDTRS